jgi:hypothetical protein
MPYGETFDLEDIEDRRKQRRTDRDETIALIRRLMESSERSSSIYGFYVSGILFIAALFMYWLVSPLAAIFVLVISAVVHLSATGVWIRNSVIVAQTNSIQGERLALELFDDLQELIAKQEKRGGK